MAVLETDYLVVGAGASGMAFTDALLAACDADVVLVDRRHRAGGHWNDAYPFVRLHQPSAYYGVNSLELGVDRVEESGPEAGFYERASGSEICGYYQRVLEQMLGTGRVRFFGMCDHTVDPTHGHVLVSRLTGDETVVRVRRRVVDATYLQGEIPSRHTPGFAVDPGVRLIAPNDLVDLGEWDATVSGFTLVGGGKTAMDAGAWLLDNGVPPSDIRWIRPRDAWFYDRALLQPRDQVASIIDGVALELEAAAEATDVADLFDRLEGSGRLMRLDPEVTPTMFRGATLSRAEAERLRRIDRVVRKGSVLRLGLDEVVLTRGSIPSGSGEVYVDCTAGGLSSEPARPVFHGDTITVQTVRIGLIPFNAAMIGHLEATRHDDAEKNRLTPPNHSPNTALDWMSTTNISTRAELLWGAEDDLPGWLETSRLNLARGMGDHFGEPRMQDAVTRLLRYREPAVENLDRLTAASVGT